MWKTLHVEKYVQNYVENYIDPACGKVCGKTCGNVENFIIKLYEKTIDILTT